MKNLLIISSLIILFIITAYFIICNIAIYLFSNRYKIDNLEDVDYILVLGAQVKADKTGSEALINRLNKVVQYKSQFNIPIIVSGGQGGDEPMAEADFMKTYLVENGVEKNLIIEENKATSTYENLKYSSEIINDKSAKILIVTTDFHALRTSMLAKRQELNFDIIGVDSDIHLKTLIREPLAIIKSFLLDR